VSFAAFPGAKIDLCFDAPHPGNPPVQFPTKFEMLLNLRKGD
jgi:hypothetical protein